MSKLKPYPKYKDSGIEWIGEVPEGWSTGKVVYGFNVLLGKMLQLRPQSDQDKVVPYYRSVNVQWEKVTNELAEMWASPADILKYTVATGDLLVCEGGEAGRAAMVDRIANSPTIIQNAVHRVRALPGFDIEYLLRLLQAASSAGWISILCNKSTILHFTQEKFNELVCTFPPLPEQQAIAAYLDRETSFIDALITKKTRSIELLREKRQAMITHAVTRGLNPNVKMKDSGVDWIGDVPEGWEVMPLKYISDAITVGIVVNPSEYISEEGLPFIYGGDIREGEIDFINSRKISLADSKLNQKTQLSFGDLLTVRVGYPGVTSVVPKECEGGNCASVMHIRRGVFNSYWLSYVMNSEVIKFQIEVVKYGAAQEQFNISHAIEFLIPTPPRNEQQSIAAFLNAYCYKINAIIFKTERSIELLKEKRQALITAAVTGKIDLREAALEVVCC